MSDGMQFILYTRRHECAIGRIPYLSSLTKSPQTFFVRRKIGKFTNEKKKREMRYPLYIIYVRGRTSRHLFSQASLIKFDSTLPCYRIPYSVLRLPSRSGAGNGTRDSERDVVTARRGAVFRLDACRINYSHYAHVRTRFVQRARGVGLRLQMCSPYVKIYSLHYSHAKQPRCAGFAHRRCKMTATTRTGGRRGAPVRTCMNN